MDTPRERRRTTRDPHRGDAPPDRPRPGPLEHPNVERPGACPHPALRPARGGGRPRG
jgi:hypothetical protein